MKKLMVCVASKLCGFLHISWVTILVLTLGACGSGGGGNSGTGSRGASNSNKSSGVQLSNCASILPVGDSITLGVNGGYRNNLYTGLLQNNCGVSYVGTQIDEFTRVADKHHEGHTGFNIDNVASSINSWTTSMQPNIILLMIGTNDTAWWTSKNADEIGANHNALIDQFESARPDAWIFVSSLPPQTSAIIQPNNIDRAELTQQVNAIIRKNVNARAAAGQRVRLVDINSVLTTDDLYDGIHPTEQAHAKVAQKFLDEIRAALGSPSTTLPVSPAPASKQQSSLNFSTRAEPLARANASGFSSSNLARVGSTTNAVVNVSSDSRTQLTLPPAAIPGASSFPANFTAFNGKLYFRAYDHVNGDKLWKTDGTANGTVLVKHIKTATTPGSFISELTVFNGALYFQADDGVNGAELWKTDGTANGTVLVKSINSAAGVRSGSFASDFITFNGTLYFGADNHLWKTDGTADGTVLVKDITGASCNPHGCTVFNGMLYFTADDDVNGRKLWKTDGTDAGTVLVKDINAATGPSSNPIAFTTLNGSLYFQADNGANGIDLWKTDGTATGTQLVKDF